MNFRLRQLALTAASTAVIAVAPATAQAATGIAVGAPSAQAKAAHGLHAVNDVRAASVKRSSPRSQDGGCGDVDVQAGESSLASQARSTLCLINRERTSRGLRALSVNGKLSAAAASHNRDMVARRYFSHSSLSGTSSADRMRSTGYMSGARSWMVGENLAWGSGTLSSPREIVAAWMKSPGHRANILNARFREIGVGIDFRAPMRVEGAAVTYTTTFGARS